MLETNKDLEKGSLEPRTLESSSDPDALDAVATASDMAELELSSENHKDDQRISRLAAGNGGGYKAVGGKYPEARDVDSLPLAQEGVRVSDQGSVPFAVMKLSLLKPQGAGRHQNPSDEAVQKQEAREQGSNIDDMEAGGPVAEIADVKGAVFPLPEFTTAYRDLGAEFGHYIWVETEHDPRITHTEGLIGAMLLRNVLYTRSKALSHRIIQRASNLRASKAKTMLTACKSL